MSVVEQKCFAIACDRCGDLYEEGAGPVHFDTPERAEAYTLSGRWGDSVWETDGEAWFCEACADTTGWFCDDCMRWFPNAVAHHTSPGWTACNECFALAGEGSK